MMNGDIRLMSNFRNQWGGLGNPFQTISASVDAPILRETLHDNFIGIGATFYNDKAGDSRLTTGNYITDEEIIKQKQDKDYKKTLCSPYISIVSEPVVGIVTRPTPKPSAPPSESILESETVQAIQNSLNMPGAYAIPGINTPVPTVIPPASAPPIESIDETDKTQKKEVVPEAVPEAVSGAVPEVVPGAVPEVVPGAVSEAVPGAVSEAVPGAVSEAVSEAVPGAVEVKPPKEGGTRSKTIKKQVRLQNKQTRYSR
jgi:hypothetical protein